MPVTLDPSRGASRLVTTPIALFVVVAIVIIVVVVLLPFIVSLLTAPEDKGPFGDQYGVANALFSGLAFAGVIAALFMQQKELRLQREELEATRNVLEAQREEAATQVKTIAHQTFESTFFRMLTLHREMIEMIWDGTGHSGSAAMEHLKNRLMVNLEVARVASTSTKRLSEIRRLYRDLYHNEFASALSHHFRYLYRILKLIDSTQLIDDQVRPDYAGVLRAQLSRDESVLTFYNCLSEFGDEKFKPLAQRYELFQNLDPRWLASPEDAQFVDPPAGSDVPGHRSTNPD